MPGQSQRGISLIEALVMLAVTSLVVAIALPVLGRGRAADFRLAGSNLSQSASDRGEETFRMLLRHAAPPPGSIRRVSLSGGGAAAVEFMAFLEAPTVCTRELGWVRVRLWMDADANGGVLRCASEGREDVLTRWNGVSRGFAFRVGDSDWRADLVAPSPMGRSTHGLPGGHADEGSVRAPVLVRFSAPAESGGETVWVEQAPAGPMPAVTTPSRVMDGGGDLDR